MTAVDAYPRTGRLDVEPMAQPAFSPLHRFHVRVGRFDGVAAQCVHSPVFARAKDKFVLTEALAFCVGDCE